MTEFLRTVFKTEYILYSFKSSFKNYTESQSKCSKMYYVLKERNPMTCMTCLTAMTMTHVEVCRNVRIKIETRPMTCTGYGVLYYRALKIHHFFIFWPSQFNRTTASIAMITRQSSTRDALSSNEDLQHQKFLEVVEKNEAGGSRVIKAHSRKHSSLKDSVERDFIRCLQTFGKWLVNE